MLSEETLKEIRPGVKIKVWETIKESGKERKSFFEGLVIARKHGKEAGASFTVRAVLSEVGVEKIYPINSPNIQKVEILSRPGRIRRSKLYFVRKLSKKKVREKLGA